MVVIAANTI